jgi:hypothetical protein
MDAVQIGQTCEALRQQGMPEHLAVIHAVTYGIALIQNDYDERYVKSSDLPTLIEKEVQRVLKRWVKWVVVPFMAVVGIFWGIISNWDNVSAFLKALGK